MSRCSRASAILQTKAISLGNIPVNHGVVVIGCVCVCAYISSLGRFLSKPSSVSWNSSEESELSEMFPTGDASINPRGEPCGGPGATGRTISAHNPSEVAL